ncbi:MAG TPA: hypothetical protein VMZ26_15995 [Pyrinomonadaceae bacterium]|nr:hypothetical protein [Pyrinomonadaceae bacterium]
MRTILFFSIVAAALLVFRYPGYAQNTATYTFANESSHVIREIYVSSIKDQNWSSDWLGSEILMPKKIFVSNEIPKGMYDIRIVAEDNKDCTRNNVLVDQNIIWKINNLVLLGCNGDVFKNFPVYQANNPPKPKIKVSTAPPKSADVVLLNNGCNRIAGGLGGYDCFTPSGYSMCLSYKNSGAVKTCKTTLDWAAVRKVSDDLFTLGCKAFLGRPDDFVCITQRGLDACEVYKKNGKVKMCRKAKE